MEAVPGEVVDVNARERMNFASNSVLSKNPKFGGLGISPAHTTDKLKSIIVPDTRAVGLIDNSDWLASRHRIAEGTEGRVIEIQAYKDYIKNSEFETRNVFERENIQMTQPDQNIQMTQPDQNIPLTRLNENIPMT